MKIHSDCGLSFKIWWILIFIFELLSTGLIVAIGIWAFLTTVAVHGVQLTYLPDPSTNFVVKNTTYKVVVTSWILVVLCSLCIARSVAAVTLVMGIRKSSAEMSKFWIAFKIFAVMMSFFLATASFNVSPIVRAATLTSLVTDLASSYFIRVLYPELDKMCKFIVMDVNPKPVK